MAGYHRGKQSAMKYISKEFRCSDYMDNNLHNCLLRALPPLTTKQSFAQVPCCSPISYFKRVPTTLLSRGDKI